MSGFTVDEAVVAGHAAGVGDRADRVRVAARACDRAFSGNAYGFVGSVFVGDLDRAAARCRDSVARLGASLAVHRDMLTACLADYQEAEAAATAGFTDIDDAAFRGP